jgi:hypothetical protein
MGLSDACWRWRTHDSSVSYTALTYRRCANTRHGSNKYYKKVSSMQWWKEHSSQKDAGGRKEKYIVKQRSKSMENRDWIRNIEILLFFSHDYFAGRSPGSAYPDILWFYGLFKCLQLIRKSGLHAAESFLRSWYSSASKYIFHLLWNTEVDRRVYKSLFTVPSPMRVASSLHPHIVFV